MTQFNFKTTSENELQTGIINQQISETNQQLADIVEQVGKIANVSIDDFYRALQDITVNAATYTSIFDNSTFSSLKTLHDTYGMKFSCFCYTMGGGFDLTTVTTKFKSEFISCKDWISFGFHGKDDSTLYGSATKAEFAADYDKFITALQSFASIDMLAKVIRTASYTGSAAVVAALRDDYKITGLLGAEDSRPAQYQLTSDEIKHLDMYHIVMSGDLSYYRTEFRLESETDATVSSKLSSLVDQERIAVFTHEQALLSTTITKLGICGAFFKKYGYGYSNFNDIGIQKTKIYTAPDSQINYTLEPNWTVRAAQTFVLKRVGKMVTIQGQLTKASDITLGEKVLTISNFVPSDNLVTYAWAFNAANIQIVPLIVNTDGSVTIGWRALSPSSGYVNIAIAVSYICK